MDGNVVDNRKIYSDIAIDIDINYQDIGADSKDGELDTKDDEINNTNHGADIKDGELDTKDDKVNRVICKYAVD